MTATSRDTLTELVSVVLSNIRDHHTVEKPVHLKMLLNSLNDIAIKKKMGVNRNAMTTAVHAPRALVMLKYFFIVLRP
jgi:hypothetical protein